MAAALRLNILELMARLALVYLVFSDKFKKTRASPKLVGQVPSGSEHFKSL